MDAIRIMNTICIHSVLLNREVSYESSQKKLMTLACATCLTIGMGAVAYADTVDLGYGLYGSTSPMVKAVEVMRVPLRMQSYVIMSKPR